MFFPPKDIVNDIKKNYPAGTIVELVKMDDFQAPPEGTRGVVSSVDDTGTIHVNWNGYGRLGIVYGEDECRKVSE